MRFTWFLVGSPLIVETTPGNAVELVDKSAWRYLVRARRCVSKPKGVFDISVTSVVAALTSIVTCTVPEAPSQAQPVNITTQAGEGNAFNIVGEPAFLISASRFNRDVFGRSAAGNVIYFVGQGLSWVAEELTHNYSLDQPLTEKQIASDPTAIPSAKRRCKNGVGRSK